MQAPRADLDGLQIAGSQPDVLVIGAGVAGLFAAYHLRQAGAGVTVVERGPLGGPQSCSAGNTGFVGTQGAAPLAEPGALSFRPRQPGTRGIRVAPRPDAGLLRWLRQFRRASDERQFAAGFTVLLELKRRSLAQLRELCAAGPLAEAFAAPGIVIAFKTADGYERARGALPAMVAGGVPLRVLDEPQLRALDPGAEFSIHGALFNAEGAYLRAAEFVVHLARELRRMGVSIVADTEVTGIGAHGRSVRVVRTTRGDVRPGQVVLAGGSWSASCASWLDIRLDLQPVKGYSVTVAATAGAPRLPVLLSEERIAVAPLGSRLRLAGLLELGGNDRTVDARRVRHLLRTARAYLPCLDGAVIGEAWTGLRPCSPDSLPFIGRAEPYLNLLIAAGHGHIGMGIAPAGGRLVAQLACGDQPDMDMTPFAVGRFSGRAARPADRLGGTRLPPPATSAEPADHNQPTLADGS